MGRQSEGRSGKRSCWEDDEGNGVGGRGNSLCKGSEQETPAAPLSSQGPGGIVGGQPWARTQQLQLEAWVQGPVRWTFSSAAVGSAHVSASGLANVPLKPHSVVLVWVWVFLFIRKNSCKARREWPFWRNFRCHGPGLYTQGQAPEPPPPAGLGEAVLPRPAGCPPCPLRPRAQAGMTSSSLQPSQTRASRRAQTSHSVCSVEPSSPGRAEPRARAQLPQLGLHPEHLPGLGPPPMPPEPQMAPSPPP